MAQIQAPEKKTDWVTPMVVVLGVGGVTAGLYFYLKKKPNPGTFTFQMPLVNGLNKPTVNNGASIEIECDIAMTGGDNFNADVIVQIQEGSILPEPGDLIEQKSFSVAMKSGATATVKFSTTAKGATGRKDVSVLINQGGARLDQHHFDDVFYTTGGVPPSGAITGLEIEHSGLIDLLPASAIPIGGTAKIHTLAVNNGAGTQAKASVSVTSPSGAVFGPYVDQDAFAATGEALDISSSNTFGISAAGTYQVSVLFYLGGVLVDSKNSTFTVAGTVVSAVTILDPVMSYGGIINYRFSGFQPYAQIYATVQGQGSAIDYPIADGSGSGLSYFYGYIDAGSYTLVVRDDYGHLATGSFVISGAQGTYNFGVQIVNAGAAFPGATHWWAYYYDPDTASFVSSGQYYPISQQINFSNIHNFGWLAVFLYNSSTGQESSQISSPPIPLVANNLSLIFDAATGEITSL